MKTIIRFIKKETVLSIAALLAVISMFFVRPDAGYAEYIDYRVLALLFCLMAVVAAMQSIGVFKSLGMCLLGHAGTTRRLALILIFLCFFCSMLITNDVALITFVPFAVMMLTMADRSDLLIPVIVLQTIAANLGSMLTPVGNPQNLYLYTSFGISMGEFLLLMLPLTLLSGVLLFIAAMLIKSRQLSIVSSGSDIPRIPRGRFILYTVLFMVCIACVLRLTDYRIMLAVVIMAVLISDRSLFKKVDYFLLLTFVCFFVFIGNMERIPAIAELMSRLILGREIILGAAFSQVISNVPAAILLSGFTENYHGLLYGVNIGGLGTLIASLASVISFRCYSVTDNSSRGKYMLVFTLYNVVFLALLLAAAFTLNACT